MTEELVTRLRTGLEPGEGRAILFLLVGAEAEAQPCGESRLAGCRLAARSSIWRPSMYLRLIARDSSSTVAVETTITEMASASAFMISVRVSMVFDLAGQQ